jgi:ankyrin repeat protein
MSQDGDSALALAASGGHTDAVVELVKELVKAGAKLDIQNKVCSYI